MPSRRVTTQVGSSPAYVVLARHLYITEYKEAFALFDKKGTGAVPRETLGDLLRALGQNPTQAEVADIVANAPRDGA
jgi:Ca2+-binding EF-hand superfamily protein